MLDDGADVWDFVSGGEQASSRSLDLDQRKDDVVVRVTMWHKYEVNPVQGGTSWRDRFGPRR
ncbi:hypothetical protein [Nocardia higoensis]|uniref:hypothetical protein n=1 Tax=Nocardia higoensis TaxID=228599 RepID=UPI00030142FE|nr:hypothetical protein [Nocardia higoensis]